MQVTSYQMHNVLDCFCKKLSKTRMPEKQSDRPADRRPTDEVSLSNESNRQAALEKISREIIVKIVGGAGARETPVEESSAEMPPAIVKAADGKESTEARFTYDVIDSIHQKRRATLTEGDTQALMKRLNQARPDQPHHKTDSWI